MNRKDLGSYYKEVKVDIEQKLSEVETLKTSIETIKIEAATNNSEISGHLGTAELVLEKINKKSTQLETDLATVEELRVKAMDPSDGLEITIDEIDTLKKQANDLKNEVAASRNLSQEDASEIATLKKQSTKKAESVSRAETKAKTSLEQIEKYYKLATDTGLAGSFDKRKGELKDSVRNWFWSFVVSTAALAALLIVLLFVTLSQEIDLGYAFSFRVIFISPLIFFVGFAAYQYSKERDLLERYAFKAVTALALESYTELLAYRFKDEDKILEFVVNSMNTIYREPHEPNDKVTSRFGFRTNSKLVSIDSTLDRINETLKDKPT
mgnify:CR=1 FL=1